MYQTVWKFPLIFNKAVKKVFFCEISVVSNCNSSACIRGELFCLYQRRTIVLKDYMIILMKKYSAEYQAGNASHWSILCCLEPVTFGTYTRIFIFQLEFSFYFKIKLVFVTPPFENNFFFHKFTCLYTHKKPSIYSSVILYIKYPPLFLKK